MSECVCVCVCVCVRASVHRMQVNCVTLTLGRPEFCSLVNHSPTIWSLADPRTALAPQPSMVLCGVRTQNKGSDI